MKKCSVVSSPLTDTSLRRTRSHLFPTRMMGVCWAGRKRRRVMRSSEALRKEARSVTEYSSRKASPVCMQLSSGPPPSICRQRHTLVSVCVIGRVCALFTDTAAVCHLTSASQVSSRVRVAGSPSTSTSFSHNSSATSTEEQVRRTDRQTERHLFNCLHP